MDPPKVKRDLGFVPEPEESWNQKIVIFFEESGACSCCRASASNILPKSELFQKIKYLPHAP
jgi:hypothetical protein